MSQRTFPKEYLFLYNVPSNNTYDGRTDHFIECYAKWEGHRFDDGRPMVYNYSPVMSKLTKIDLLLVKDWVNVLLDIDKIAMEHFADLELSESKTA